MTGLRILVGVMSVLLIAGVIALVIGVTRLAGGPGGAEATITLPAGLMLEQVGGGGEALTLLTRDGAGKKVILLIDPKTAKPLGRYTVEETK